MPRRLACLALASLGLSVSACAGMGILQVGYQAPYDTEASPGMRGVTVAGHLGLGIAPEFPGGIDAS